MSLIQMSVSGAVMILVITAVRAISINRLPKKNVCCFVGAGSGTAAGAVLAALPVQCLLPGRAFRSRTNRNLSDCERIAR